jgi:anaerobic magnesium-protoporphyrin IX monomethyl ester cyclase
VSSALTTDAILIGWENQENLGLRYVMAYLEAHGYRTILIPFSPDNPDVVLDAVVREQPRLVGFSIIFQYNVHEFSELMDKLRRAGIKAHFTAGGHFPSLCPELTLRELPSLDSIVRFEGELTALELLSKLDQPDAWHNILGLAYRAGSQVVINPPRPLVADLDSFPWPTRGESPQKCRGIPAAPMLASRGCLHNCTFCSIRQFYGGAPGPLRRSRQPREVVAEMQNLFVNQGVKIFLFQDDDFAARTVKQRQWVEKFLSALDASGLSGSICWKISCRVDDVELDLMTRCRARGLLTVYLGVESGNARGLSTLGKRVSVDQNLRALHILKQAGLEYDMGFMLFDPDSTFESIEENLRFLRKVAELEGPPISFVKMLPLAGTSIYRRLALEGRLTGNEIRPDYNLLDRRLDYYYLFVLLNFSHRNSDPDGLVEHLRQAYFDCLVARTFGFDSYTPSYQSGLRSVIDRANRSALDTLEEALMLIKECPDAETAALSWDKLNRSAEKEARARQEVLTELDTLLEKFNPGLGLVFREADLRSANKP